MSSTGESGVPTACAAAADALAARVSADVRSSFLAAVKDVQGTVSRTPAGAAQAEESTDVDMDRRRLFHEKEFKVRESILSQMLAHATDDSYRAIYHALVASLMWLGVKLILQDYHTRGIVVDFNLLTWAFDKGDVVMRTWIVLQLSAFAVIPLVQWMGSRPNDWSVFKRAVAIHITLIISMFVFASWVCISYRLPPSSGMIVMCEATRLVMKMHAYIREKAVHGLRAAHARVGNGPLVRTSSASSNTARTTTSAPSSTTEPAARSPVAADARPNSSIETLQQWLQRFADYLPPKAIKSGITVESIRAAQPAITIESLNEEIGRYVYFLFAPTIVYRDSYPQTEGPVNWLRAGVHAGNLAAVVLYTYVIIRSALTPILATPPPVHPIDVVLLVQSTMLPAMLTFLLSFFGILHSWLNLFAELLKFGDRQFYHRWWSATSWASYYRRWNMVVGDWLHAYIYQDMQRFGLSQGGAEAGVFIISAIVHELILACAFRFWLPALLLMFGGPGVWFMRLTRKFAKRFANIFMWAMLSIGLAMLTVMYSRELYARYGYEWVGETTDPAHYRQYDPTIHPSPSWTTWDYVKYVIIPRSWIEYGRLWIAHGIVA